MRKVRVRADYYNYPYDQSIALIHNKNKEFFPEDGAIYIEVEYSFLKQYLKIKKEYNAMQSQLDILFSAASEEDYESRQETILE
jgi:hypothetical protein